MGRWERRTTSGIVVVDTLAFMDRPASGTYTRVNELTTPGSGCRTVHRTSGTFTLAGTTLTATATSDTSEVADCDDASRDAAEGPSTSKELTAQSVSGAADVRRGVLIITTPDSSGAPLVRPYDRLP